MLDKLSVQLGEHVLDVGCGTGAQVLPILGRIGSTGTVSACDISEESILQLRNAAPDDSRLQAVVADMADLSVLIDGTFRQKSYSLALAVYSLYYSSQRMTVLKTMASHLTSTGRVVVFSPISPHGLVELAAQFGDITPPIHDCLAVFPMQLLAAFRQLFWDVRVDYFQSTVSVTSLEDFMTFYRATTYFQSDAEAALQDHAESLIQRQGSITYPKNGFLIQGRCTRDDVQASLPD